jgi:DNA-binding NarL/FixJ family response regulator
VRADDTWGRPGDKHLNGAPLAAPTPERSGLIRLLLVEPRAIIGAGVRQLLERQQDFEVVAEVRSTEEAARMAARKSPDVLVVDVDLPDADAVEATRHLRRRTPGAPMVILGHDGGDDSVFRAVQTGANAHVVDEEDPSQLLDAIRRVADGQDPLVEAVSARPALAQRVADAYRELAVSGAVRARPASPLSPRQLDIIRLVAKGMSNEEIARALEISQQTVKNHMTAAMRSLGVRRRGQAVVAATKAGWVSVGS